MKMNKHYIRNLVEKSGIELTSNGFNVYTEFASLSELEKFAKLIVLECANVIADDDLAKDCDTFMMDSWAKGMRYSANLIKEHFGVEG